MTTNYGKQTSEITSTSGSPVVVTSAAGSSNYVLQAGNKIGQLFGFLMIKDLNAINPSTGLPAIPDAQKSLYVRLLMKLMLNNGLGSPKLYCPGIL